MNNFVITNGLLTNIYKKKLLDNNFVEKNNIMGLEYGFDIEERRENEKKVYNLLEAEKIDIFF